MARGVKWGCSYKKITLTVCSINIVVALYVVHSLYGSLSYNDIIAVKHTPDQIRIMEDTIRTRSAKEPVELVQIVRRLKEEFNKEDSVIELPPDVKTRITDEILQRLRSLNVKANISEQREAVESWRGEKIKQAKQSILGAGLENSSFQREEAGILIRALESNWAMLSENIGLWLPTEIINQAHDDRPEGAEEEEESEDEILPGRPVPPECHAELHTDYDGAAVRWGLTHHKESAADCCQACLDQAKRAKPGDKKCNIWVYCPSETGCYSPDIYEHKNQECWLKYAEKPKLNFKDKYSESYRSSHPNAPVIVPWVSGVISV